MYIYIHIHKPSIKELKPSLLTVVMDLTEYLLAMTSIYQFNIDDMKLSSQFSSIQQ